MLRCYYNAMVRFVMALVLVPLSVPVAAAAIVPVLAFATQSTAPPGPTAIAADRGDPDRGDPDRGDRADAHPDSALWISDLVSAYDAAYAALVQGSDLVAQDNVNSARRAFDACSAVVRERLTDGAVRQELRLAAVAKARFEAIGSDASPELQQQKRRLLLFLAADGTQEFVGTYARAARLNPNLLGLHCKRAELFARFDRFVLDAPCPTDVGDNECEEFKSTSMETSALRGQRDKALHDCRAR